MDKKFVLLSIIVVMTSCVGAAIMFYTQFFIKPQIKTQCVDGYGHFITYQPGTVPEKEFSDCINRNAKLFIEKDYELSKDLSKSFLTLLAGLLVASITFSEKIVVIGSSNTAGRTLMICCWLFLLTAMIACGVALAFMTIAAGWASYQPFRDFRIFEPSALYLFLSAGISFGLAMTCLLLAGVIALSKKRKV